MPVLWYSGKLSFSWQFNFNFKVKSLTCQSWHVLYSDPYSNITSSSMCIMCVYVYLCACVCVCVCVCVYEWMLLPCLQTAQHTKSLINSTHVYQGICSSLYKVYKSAVVIWWCSGCLAICCSQRLIITAAPPLRFGSSLITGWWSQYVQLLCCIHTHITWMLRWSTLY